MYFSTQWFSAHRLASTDVTKGRDELIGFSILSLSRSVFVPWDVEELTCHSEEVN